MTSVGQRLFVSACAGTGQTERAAQRLGARFFLPKLFEQRYVTMGDLDRAEFSLRLDEARSFTDEGWCDHWDRYAAEFEERADAELSVAPNSDVTVESLLRQAITYYAVSAFPGTSPRRLVAYQNVRRLFERFLGLRDRGWEKLPIDVADETVEGWLHLPRASGPHPLVIATNGLEGTAAEIVFALAGYEDRQAGMFVMEMPGTYAYRYPMGDRSERVYHGVIAHLAADDRVDAERIGFLGVSFGGYWAARMAATNSTLACAVASGPPTAHTFKRSRSLGVPRVMIDALLRASGESRLTHLSSTLGRLSLERRDLYRRIGIPLLVINGDSDTLVSSRDSYDLALKAPQGMLKFYEDDDHCAMGHFRQWLDLAVRWFERHLGIDTGRPCP